MIFHTNGALLSDFDGTLTDSAALSRDFKRGYLGELATLTSRTIKELDSIARLVEREMRQRPAAFDWTHQGNIVSSAVSDPSLRFIGITERILDESDRCPQGEERNRLLHELFIRHYPETSSFRAHAARLLGARSPVCYIVSNSSTARVQHNIEALRSRSRHNIPQCMHDRVRGNARKQFIDNAWTDVPVSMTIDGLERPVLLRRKFYYDAIDGLLTELGLDWHDVTFMGDNFELDLMLPMHLGASGILMANKFTPWWEKNFMFAHPRGHVVTTLREVFKLR